MHFVGLDLGHACITNIVHIDVTCYIVTTLEAQINIVSANVFKIVWLAAEKLTNCHKVYNFLNTIYMLQFRE